MEYTGLLSRTNTTNTSNLSDCHSIPSLEPHFVLSLQITVGTTCVLSILGAGLIILTYIAFRDLRTTARQLLVNLSIADIVVAASHFVGLLAVLDLYGESNPCSASRQLSGDNVSATIIAKETVDNVICQVQGGFTLFGTLGSFLWTIAVAVYLFVVSIVADKPSLGRRLRFVFYPVCWGIPAGIAVAFGVKGYLGFEENLDIGRFDEFIRGVCVCVWGGGGGGVFGVKEYLGFEENLDIGRFDEFVYQWYALPPTIAGIG